MSLKKSELIEKNLYELTFDVDRATFEAAIEKAYRRSAKNINIPGFRRGKAPRSIIEKMYGKGVFYEDAINDIIPAAYTEAAKESALEIVSQPEFDVETIDDNGVVLKAKVYVKPEVKIENYLGIEATRTLVPTTDADVDAEIEKVRARNSRMIDVTDRAAQLDDIANIDYEGSVDGIPFDGGKAEGHDLKLGSGQFIPGFEDQIVSHAIGDEFDVNVTFPTEYHAEELAGKAAVFKVKLNALKVNELPELDDEFVRDVSEFDTLDEYKADIKAKLEEKNAKMADNAVEDQLLEALMNKLEAESPEAMFETETENFVRDYDNRLRMQGLDLATYFKYTGMNLDMMRQQLRPQAEKQVKTRLALEKIAELENIVVSDEEIEAEYSRIAEAYGMEIEKVKETVDADSIAADMKVKKAVDLVKEKAVVTDAAPAADAE
ncbi:MAG: trigger factor [Clostridia bacterium]|nr:trigger factor [Clostridia bacterium]